MAHGLGGMSLWSSHSITFITTARKEETFGMKDIVKKSVSLHSIPEAEGKKQKELGSQYCLKSKCLASHCLQ